jgi:hypothetical protein
MTPRITPVPVRYGQYLRDDAAAVVAAGTSHETWMALLRRFEGAVEYGLRVFDPAREAEPATAVRTGTEYMAALARRTRGPADRVEAVLSVLRPAVSDLVLEERSEPLRTAHGLVSVAHLLHATAAVEYGAAIEGVRKQLPELRLLSTGPWPPYSFVAR